jgi:hypothetical protein
MASASRPALNYLNSLYQTDEVESEGTCRNKQLNRKIDCRTAACKGSNFFHEASSWPANFARSI